MKGQTQPVVLTLTATVIIGSITTVYIWGEPLLDKGQSQAEIQNIEQDALELHDQIIQVSNSGEGASETIRIGEGVSASSDFEITVNDEENYVQISERIENSPYPANTWTAVEGRSFQNLTMGEGAFALEGDDLPGVVAVNPRGTSEEQILTYRIDFRNMFATTSAGNRLERIQLVTEGRSTTSDPSTLVISNEGQSWETGDDNVELPSGERVDRLNTRINVDIR